MVMLEMRNSSKQKVITIGTKPVRVEVADTEESRRLCLMHRDSLEHDGGMLFIFDDMDDRGFWMKNTRIPLSIAFIDNMGQILNIEDMHPYDSSTTRSNGNAQCALEMNQGWFTRNKISAGDMIEGIWDGRNNESFTISLNSLKKIIKEEISR